MRYFSDILKIRNSIIYNSKVRNNIKIACIGDIHISRLVGEKDIKNISVSLYNSNPDYICLLGDLIDSPDELTKKDRINNLKNLVKDSSSIAPTFIILGSHDFIDENTLNSTKLSEREFIWEYLNSLNNIYLLNDEKYEDDNITIAGYKQKKEAYNNLINKKIEDSKAYYRDLSKQLKLLKNIQNNKPSIFLTHSPEPIHDKINQDLLKDYDIIITAHFHNGCIPAFLDNIWPKNSGIITPNKRLLPKMARGIVKLDTQSYLVYNGGWTKIQDCAPKILHPLDKLCNRQMDLITISNNKELKKYIDEMIIKNKGKKLILYK